MRPAPGQRGPAWFCLAVVLLLPLAVAADDDDIASQLASGRSALVRTAIQSIHGQLERRPEQAVSGLRSTYLKILMETGRYDEAAALAEHGIDECAYDTQAVEDLLRWRIAAFLKSGRQRQALACAKSLFNVSTMQGTAAAMLQFAECLNAARPRDGDLVDRFRQEQLARAHEGAAGSGPTVLGTVKVDTAAYDHALQLFYAKDYVIHANELHYLTGKGNLLLLADRPAQARQMFEKALSIADEQELGPARESVARAIKAADGGIGRANAYLLGPHGQGRK